MSSFLAFVFLLLVVMAVKSKYYGRIFSGVRWERNDADSMFEKGQKGSEKRQTE